MIKDKEDKVTENSIKGSNFISDSAHLLHCKCH